MTSPEQDFIVCNCHIFCVCFFPLVGLMCFALFYAIVLLICLFLFVLYDGYSCYDPLVCVSCRSELEIGSCVADSR